MLNRSMLEWLLMVSLTHAPCLLCHKTKSASERTHPAPRISRPGAKERPMRLEQSSLLNEAVNSGIDIYVLEKSVPG